MSDNKNPLNKNRPNDGASERYSPVRFVSFNVLHGRRAQSEGHRIKGEVDIPALLDDLADLGGDVVGLQEVDRRTLRVRLVDITASVATRFGMSARFARTKWWFPVGSYGVSLLATTPLRDVRVLRLFRGSRRWEPRAVVTGTVTIDGLDWRVGTTHLSFRRQESFQQLDQALSEFDGFDGPCVLVGDFNMRPHEITPVVVGRGWKVNESEFTYSSWEPAIRIDYVLCRNCEPVANEVRTMRISDHRALIVDVQP